MTLRILNKSCLQKPRRQTYVDERHRPKPSLHCPERVQAWLAKQEAEINRRFNLGGLW